jgi:TonB-linked SusC/RagA family outer membrane protein
MKKLQYAIVLLLMVLCTTPASALPGKTVTLNMKSVSMEAFLQEIKKQTEVNFLYNSQIIKGEVVTVKARNEAWQSVLGRVLEAHDLTYEVKNDVVVIRRVERRNINVSGIVISDEDDQPVIGVSVRVKGSKKAAITDENGHFSLNSIPEGTLLTFSYVGMMESEAKARRDMQVSMHSNAKELQEVVVTGYQVLNKRGLTSAVTTVKAEDLMRSDVNSLDQMLQGKVPDLISVSNSGEIGVAPKIRIRGTSTLIGNREPLWVVDGIVVSDPVEISPEELNDPDYVNRIGNAIAGLNPQDIARIDVLKDAAATAIYGTKAANGVIVVTTKRGFEGKPQVSYNMSVNYKIRPRYTDHSVDVMNSKERIQFSRELAQDHYWYDSGDTMVGYELALQNLYNNKITNDEFNSQVSKMETMNTDWFKLLTHDSFSTQHTVSMSGGSHKSRYYASIGYDKENDVVKVNHNERYTASVNIDNTFTKWLSTSISANAYINKRDYYQSEIAPLQYAYQTTRCIPAYDDNGEYSYYVRKYSKYQSFKYNILNELDNSSNKQDVSSFTINANMKFTITDWLRANAIVSFTNSDTDIEGFWGDKSYHASYLRDSEYGVTPTYPSESYMPQGGELTKENARNRSWVTRLQVDMDKYFGKDNEHNINATLGYEMSSVRYKDYSNVTRGYYPDRGKTFVQDIDLSVYTGYATWLAGNVPTITDNLTNELSVYASVTYAYRNLFHLNVNGRVDGSNKFGNRSNEKFLPIWSVSGSYNLGDCGLFHAKWIDYLTMKASYGYQGNMLSTESPVMTIKKNAMDSYYNEYTSTVNTHPIPI